MQHHDDSCFRRKVSDIGNPLRKVTVGEVSDIGNPLRKKCVEKGLN